MDAVTQVPAPRNEPVLTYAPGTPERAELQLRLTELAAAPVELTATIGGEQRRPGGPAFDVVAPHRHAQVLGTSAHSTTADATAAVRCAKEAAPPGSRCSPPIVAVSSTGEAASSASRSCSSARSGVPGA